MIDAVHDVADQISSIRRSRASRSTSTRRRSRPKPAYDIGMQRSAPASAPSSTCSRPRTRCWSQRRLGVDLAGRALTDQSAWRARWAAAGSRRPMHTADAARSRTASAATESADAERDRLDPPTESERHRHGQQPTLPHPRARRRSAAANNTRRRALTGLAAVVVLRRRRLGHLLRWCASHYESTDNAYVQGNVVQVTPQIGGTVIAISADDTDFVKAGQPLVKLDPADAGRARPGRGAAGAGGAPGAHAVSSTTARGGADRRCARPTSCARQSDLARAQDDLKRRPALADRRCRQGRVQPRRDRRSRPPRAALAAAQSALAAREQLGLEPVADRQHRRCEQHPERAARRGASARGLPGAAAATTLPAPVDGYVAKRSVQLGQRVPPARR